MGKRRTLQVLAHRVAEESQLLAEEKWIIETLSKIKKQRNCLQIERLQLESMRNQINSRAHRTPSRQEPYLNNLNANAPINPISIIQSLPEPKPVEPTTTTEQILETEALCNKEELDLNVTSSLFCKVTPGNLNIEEDEEEDDDNYEDVLIDMNMFMHGEQNTAAQTEN